MKHNVSLQGKKEGKSPVRKVRGRGVRRRREGRKKRRSKLKLVRKDCATNSTSVNEHPRP